MNVEFKNKKLVTKCNINMELVNDREVHAFENICRFAEDGCLRDATYRGTLKTELDIINQLLKGIKPVVAISE